MVVLTFKLFDFQIVNDLLNFASMFSFFGQLVAYCPQRKNASSFYWNQIQSILRFHALSYGYWL